MLCQDCLYVGYTASSSDYRGIYMKSRSLLALSALALISACGKTEAPAEENKAGGKSSATVAETGVAECDEYLNKVMACIKDKVPEAQRKMMEDGIKQSKASWASVSDKSQLAATCKQAMDQAKASYGAMGCSF